MKKPVLVVMAAGMGSRYGGLKQIDPVDSQGHIIMDFSIYDAVRAGFEKVIFIIKKENEADFRSAIGDRISSRIEVSYVYQDLANLPDGYSVPEGRLKPWGTGHAVLSCIDEVDGPLAVINADDYYGTHAFRLAYDFLTQRDKEGRSDSRNPSAAGSAAGAAGAENAVMKDEAAEDEAADNIGRYMMVGYRLDHTLTENGSVARGVCETDGNGYLETITERTCIERRGDEIAYTEDGGATWTPLAADTTVSLNMWGFSGDILVRLKERFRTFLDDNLAKNPLKCEYFLPFVVDELLSEGKAAVKVMKSPDKWYGVTYKEDKPVLMDAIQKMKDEGIYPEEW
ncbi:MAG: nucleotidyltransferase [Lachnospiraceae bacterium]|nr:nucleotidyltransferase [Lachnospiraceae bacterium]